MPEEIQALVWNACGALTIICLVVAIVKRSKSYAMLCVAAWWIFEETLVTGCSIARIFHRWDVYPGLEQCSAEIGFEMGLISTSICAALAVLIYKENKRAANTRP